MVLAKDLKRMLNVIPDDAPVCIGDSYGCSIASVSYGTFDGIAKLHLTDGFEITTTAFMKGIFEQMKNGHRD